MVPKKVFGASLGILCGILGGAVSFWAVHGDEAREFNYLEKNALCVLDLGAGTPSASASFTTARTIEQFQVGVRARGKREGVSLSISGREGLICRVTMDNRNVRFGCGHNIPPGTYDVTLRQESGDHGALVVIAGERPVFVTGWQVLSRAYLGLLVLSGLWAAVARQSRNAKHRAMSSYVFQFLLLGFLLMFLYLLFHEGGHALVEMWFGRYDFGRSDFWGIHGTPHSGGTSGPSLEPWQQALISGGGPWLPTFGGWALFLLWRSRLGGNLRSARMMNMYYSAIVAMLVFPGFIVTPGCLLGIISSDGDWNGFITNVPGPLWLVKGVLWGTVLVNGIILWRVVPELWRIVKMQSLEFRGYPKTDSGGS